MNVQHLSQHRNIAPSHVEVVRLPLRYTRCYNHLMQAGAPQCRSMCCSTCSDIPIVSVGFIQKVLDSNQVASRLLRETLILLIIVGPLLEIAGQLQILLHEMTNWIATQMGRRTWWADAKRCTGSALLARY